MGRVGTGFKDDKGDPSQLIQGVSPKGPLENREGRLTGSQILSFTSPKMGPESPDKRSRSCRNTPSFSIWPEGVWKLFLSWGNGIQQGWTWKEISREDLGPSARLAAKGLTEAAMELVRSLRKLKKLKNQRKQKQGTKSVEDLGL